MFGRCLGSPKPLHWLHGAIIRCNRLALKPLTGGSYRLVQLYRYMSVLYPIEVVVEHLAASVMSLNTSPATPPRSYALRRFLLCNNQ